METELGISEIRRVRERNADLTQLVGFFTGLMRDGREVEAEAKKNLFSYVRGKLNVEALDEKHLGDNPKFNVRNLLV
jgi:hypothetical protein